MLRQNIADSHIYQKRLRLLFGLAALLVVALIAKLGWIQFVQAEELQRKAWDQWNKNIAARSSRGMIYDRNGSLLAGNAAVETVVAIPPMVEDAYFTAKVLAPVLDMDEARIFSLITQEKSLIYIKRMVDEEIANEVRLLNLPGISFTMESKRYYPNGSLMSQGLGFVGTDQGWGGLEVFYEEELKGRDGSIVFPSDARGREIPGVRQYVPPKEGMDLILTIDETIQFIVERELSKAMLQYAPERILAIAVQPKTGEILAAASTPNFDPNNYTEYNSDYLRLFPVTDTFEPGSTFKLITLAAAIEEDLYREEERFYCSGAVRIAGSTVRCWTSTHGGHGAIDFLEAVEGSCNPAFIVLGDRLGAGSLFSYIRAFGFGVRSGIDYPGEGTGLIFREQNVGPVELATTSFGQGISVTPLQQVMAVAAIANGGYLLEPYLVKGIRDPDTGIVQERTPQIVRQVISAETAAKTSLILEKVVNDGSGVNAFIEGYRIAGKTGTAQKVGAGGVYAAGDYLLSFIGYAPADDPEILLYIAVDGARRGPQWGSQVSAPLFRSIMKDVLSYMEIPPAWISDEDEMRIVTVPNLNGLTVDDAAALLTTHGLLIKPVGQEGVIKEQNPKAGASVPLQTNILVYLDDIISSAENGALSMPDLLGMTIKEAGEVLGELGLRMEPVGSGIAVSQAVEAGVQVQQETLVRVFFSSPLANN